MSNKDKTIRLEYESAADLERAIGKIMSKYLDLKVYEVFFFGSRVTGKGNEHSDIDVGIEGPRPVEGNRMASMRDELENLNVLYSIDLVDFAKVDPKFRAVAKQKIVSLKVD